MNDKTEKPKQYIAIVYQKLWQSIVSDLTTMGICFALLGVGIFMDSIIMQFIGGIMFLIYVLGRATNSPYIHRVKSVDEARKVLDEIEKGIFND